MATIRRVLIAIVGLMLIVDAGALAYVKFTSGPAPSDEKSKLVLWVDNAAQAKTAEAVIKEQNYEVILKADKRKKEVEADFRVVMNGNKKLLDPIAQILRQGGHQQLSFSEDGSKLYYGGFFKQKAQALRTVERIKAKEQLVFEVVPGVRVQATPSHKVVMMSVPANMVTALISDVESKGVKIDDWQETPLEAKPEEASSSEEEE